MAPYSEETKIYWSQWDSLCVQGGVLFRMWESPAGDKQIMQLLLPKKLRPQVLGFMLFTIQKLEDTLECTKLRIELGKDSTGAVVTGTQKLGAEPVMCVLH